MTFTGSFDLFGTRIVLETLPSCLLFAYLLTKRLLIPALCWAPFRHIDVLQNPTPEVSPNTDDLLQEKKKQIIKKAVEI